MTSRHRLQKANDSRSLWNYTLSPGWTEEAGEALRKAIMRYGCGNWQKIQRHFPDKTNGQLNLQTQRLFGQQSLATWNKVHVDPLKIKRINDSNTDAFRKNGCIVNTGDNMRQETKTRLRKENELKYGMKKEEYQRIRVPIIMEPRLALTMQDKIKQLKQMYQVYGIMTRYKENLKANKLGKRPSSDGKTINGNNNNNNNDRVFTEFDVDEKANGNSNVNGNNNGTAKKKTTTKKKSNLRKSGKKKAVRKSAKKSNKKGKNTRSTKKKNNNKLSGKKRKAFNDDENPNDVDFTMPPAKKSRIEKKNSNNNDNDNNNSEMNGNKMDNNDKDVVVTTNKLDNDEDNDIEM